MITVVEISFRLANPAGRAAPKAGLQLGNYSGVPSDPFAMCSRALCTLADGYGLALGLALIAGNLGVGAWSSMLIFWLGGAVLTLILPLLGFWSEREQPTGPP
jgi:hypothetical protein